MKALVYHGPGQKAWEEVPDPQILQPTDVIVRVDTTTICGTDLHILKGDVPAVAEGRILGHEGVGTVREVGSAVATVQVGDRVLVPTDDGPEVAECVWAAQWVSEETDGFPKVAGLAGDQDLRRDELLRKRKAEAKVAAKKLIKSHELPMKVVAVDHVLDQVLRMLGDLASVGPAARTRHVLRDLTWPKRARPGWIGHLPYHAGQQRLLDPRREIVTGNRACRGEIGRVGPQ